MLIIMTALELVEYGCKKRPSVDLDIEETVKFMLTHFQIFQMTNLMTVHKLVTM